MDSCIEASLEARTRLGGGVPAALFPLHDEV